MLNNQCVFAGWPTKNFFLTRKIIFSINGSIFFLLIVANAGLNRVLIL